MNSVRLIKQASVVLAGVFFCVSLDGTHEVRSEANKMLLMILPLLAKKRAEGPLSGYWYYTHNGYELNMSQNGDQLSANYTNLSSDSIFSIGDQAIRGTLKDKKFIGKIYERFPLEIKESCPNNWEMWGDLELTLSDDLKSFVGKYKTYTISTSDCRVEDGVWHQINITKIFTPLSNPAKAIEVKDANLSLGVMVEAKDKRSGLILAGKKDTSGNLIQIIDVTSFENIDNPENIIQIHFNEEQRTVRAFTSNRDFAVIDNYNPLTKTVSVREGKINSDGTEQVTYQENNIPVDEKELFGIDSMITGWQEQLKGKAKALLSIAAKLSPFGINIFFKEMANTIQADISKDDQCVIENVEGFSKFMDGFRFLADIIKNVFLLRVSPIDYIKNETLKSLLMKILNPDDGAGKMFQTCGEVCCYQLQELCRKYGDEIYDTQCTCTTITYDDWKIAQIRQECEAIGGVFEYAGGFAFCKQWDLEPPSTCENK